jgi:hypothetical protein
VLSSPLVNPTMAGNMADKTTRCVLFLALLGDALSGPWLTPAAVQPPERPERMVPSATTPVRVLRDESRRGYALQAADAPGKEIGAALAAATNCVVEMDAGLRERRFTLDIAARPPERLFRAVARQTGARLSVSFRLRPAAPSDQAHPPDRRPPFATQYLSVRASPALAPSDIGRILGTRIEVSEGVGGQAQGAGGPPPAGLVPGPYRRAGGRPLGDGGPPERTHHRGRRGRRARADAGTFRRPGLPIAVERRDELVAEREWLENYRPKSKRKASAAWRATF